MATRATAQQGPSRCFCPQNPFSLPKSRSNPTVYRSTATTGPRIYYQRQRFAESTTVSLRGIKIVGQDVAFTVAIAQVSKFDGHHGPSPGHAVRCRQVASAEVAVVPCQHGGWCPLCNLGEVCGSFIRKIINGNRGR